MTEHAKRLLLVDDDEFFRCTTAARLRHLGYEVREAAGGEDAVLRPAALQSSARLVTVAHRYVASFSRLRVMVVV